MCDKNPLLVHAAPPSTDRSICVPPKKKKNSTSISIVYDPNSIVEQQPPNTKLAELQKCDTWIRYLIFLNLIIILAGSFILMYRWQNPKRNIAYTQIRSVIEMSTAEPNQEYENSVERPPLDDTTPVPTNLKFDYKELFTFVRKLYNKVV